MMQQMIRCDRGLPRSFCWTRFGTEAGEAIDTILARKEAERQTNGGVFFWGIGNSVAPGIAELVRRVDEPEVLFSPIKRPPRRVDVAPSCTARWTAAEALLGGAFELPSCVSVISRWDPARRQAAHYALVCSSAEPLDIADRGRLKFGALRNLRSGSPLGTSQITAVVHRADSRHGGGDYPVAFRAALVAPYFVRLREPIPLDSGGLAARAVAPLGRAHVPGRQTAQRRPAALEPVSQCAQVALADDGAGEAHERLVDLGETLVAGPEAAKVVQPGEGPLDDPATPSKA